MISTTDAQTLPVIQEAPASGEIRYEEVDLSLPELPDFSQTAGDETALPDSFSPGLPDSSEKEKAEFDLPFEDTDKKPGQNPKENSEGEDNTGSSADFQTPENSEQETILTDLKPDDQIEKDSEKESADNTESMLLDHISEAPQKQKNEEQRNLKQKETRQPAADADQPEAEAEEAKKEAGDLSAEADAEKEKKPIRFELNKDKLSLILSEDVDRASSIIRFNDQQVHTDHLQLKTGIKNHLTYELKDRQGMILESSEHFFVLPSDPEFSDSEKLPVTEGSVLGIYQEMQIPASSVSSQTGVQIYLDGKLQEPDRPITVNRNNRELKAEYIDEWGMKKTDRIEIRPLASIKENISRPDLMMIDSNTMKITLEGDWKGMSLKMFSEDDQESGEIPFESDCLLVGLQAGKSYRFSLSHDLLKEEVSWNFSIPSSAVSENRKPENTQPDLKKPDAAKPEMQSPIQSEQKESSSKLTQNTISAAEDQKTSLAKPELKNLQFSFSVDGISLKNDSVAQIDSSASEKVRIENGTIRKARYRNSLSDQSYESLEQARKANPKGTIEAVFELSDLYGQEEIKTFTLIPALPKSDGVFEIQSQNILSAFTVDENGKLNQELMEFASSPAMICKGLSDVSKQKILEGDEVRIYLNVPQSEAKIYINDMELENPEFKEDELGVAFVSLKADEAMNIRVVSEATGKTAQTRIEPVKAKTGTVSTGSASALSLPAAALSALSALLCGLIMEGRRRFG